MYDGLDISKRAVWFPALSPLTICRRGGGSGGGAIRRLGSHDSVEMCRIFGRSRSGDRSSVVGSGDGRSWPVQPLQKMLRSHAVPLYRSAVLILPRERRVLFSDALRTPGQESRCATFRTKCRLKCCLTQIPDFSCCLPYAWLRS